MFAPVLTTKSIQPLVLCFCVVVSSALNTVQCFVLCISRKSAPLLLPYIYAMSIVSRVFSHNLYGMLKKEECGIKENMRCSLVPRPKISWIATRPVSGRVYSNSKLCSKTCRNTIIENVQLHVEK